MNLAHAQARGEYIVHMCADDIFLPGKFAKQIEILDAQPQVAAVFTHLQLIDRQGRPYTRHPIRHFKHLFNQPSHSRHEWLRRLFVNNQTASQTVMMRKAPYDTCGGYDARFVVYPDYELFIRMAIAGHEFHVIQEELTLYRRFPRGTNASAKTMPIYNKGRLEQRHLLSHYLKIASVQEFARIFGSAPPGAVDALIPYYVACQALAAGTRTHREFALDTLYAMMADPDTIRELQTRHGFTLHDYHRLTATNALGFPRSGADWLRQAVLPPLAIYLHDFLCGWIYPRNRIARALRWVA